MKLKESIYQTLPIIGAFFIPALWIITLVFLCVMIDTYFGIRASRFSDKKITPNRFSDVFAKLIGYGVFITIGLILNLITEWKYCVWLSAIIPIFTELKSIDENQKVLGKKGIIKQSEEVFQFALKIKKKKDELR